VSSPQQCPGRGITGATAASHHPHNSYAVHGPNTWLVAPVLVLGDDDFAVRLRGGQWDATISVMGDGDVAQAVELIRALRDHLREMTAQLTRIERQDLTDAKGRTHAMRPEAAALLRDIREAQALIDRLQRRYLSGDELTQQRPAAG